MAYVGQYEYAAATAAIQAIPEVVSLFDGGDGCNAQFPAGYVPIPGQPNAAANPCDGVILWRSGNRCRISPSPQTESGQPMTEQQRREWGIPPCPTGATTAPAMVTPTGAVLGANLTAWLPWLVLGGLGIAAVWVLMR